MSLGQQLENDIWVGFTSAGAGGAMKPAMGGGLFETQNVWSAPAGNGAATNGSAGGMDLFGSAAASGQQQAQKKDDAFGDIWGGFK